MIDSYDDIVSLIEDEAIEYIIFTDFNCSNEDDDPRIDSAQAFPPRSEALVADWELVLSVSSFESGNCDTAIHPRTKIAFSAGLYHQLRSGPYIEIYRIP